MSTNKYQRAGAIKVVEVRFQDTPTGKALLKGIAAQKKAEARRSESRLALDRWSNDDAWAAKQSLDTLQREGKAAESGADRAAKECAALSREHAATVVGASAKEAARIEEALAERTSEIAAAASSIVAALDAIDELKSELVVVNESTPQQLERYRLRVFTHGARNGLKLIDEFISPPVRSSLAGPVRSRNFGPRLSPEGDEFLGRQE